MSRSSFSASGMELSHVSVQHRTEPRQRLGWKRATSASNVAPSHVSCQHAWCHVADTYMTKLVTMFTSHRRRAITWRKMCQSLKRSSSVTKMVDSSQCVKCDACSTTISKSS
jgi:hypothetical protein